MDVVRGMSDFSRKWALKWVEGSIIGYIKGSTPLNILIGRIKRSITSYRVTMEDVEAIIDMIERNPVYLPDLPRQQKLTRIKLLRGAMERAISRK